jgi:hypothetical protein
MSDSNQNDLRFPTDAMKWNLVAEAVFGIELQASCNFTNGDVVFSRLSRPATAKQDLQLLARILRSDMPLPPVAREWLADLFDPNGQTDFWVEALSPRNKHQQRTAIAHDWDAADNAESRMERGKEPGSRRVKWSTATEDAATECGVSRARVERAIRRKRAAKKIHDEIQ